MSFLIWRFLPFVTPVNTCNTRRAALFCAISLEYCNGTPIVGALSGKQMLEEVLICYIGVIYPPQF